MLSNNAEAAENGNIFPLFSVFNALSHTPEVHMQHTKSLQSRLESVVCVCVCNFSIPACIVGSEIDLKNLEKIKGVP
jgi:hypothetical protein